MGNKKLRAGGMSLEIYVSGIKNLNDAQITLHTKEDYSLKIHQQDGNVVKK